MPLFIGRRNRVILGDHFVKTFLQPGFLYLTGLTCMVMAAVFLVKHVRAGATAIGPLIYWAAIFFLGLIVLVLTYVLLSPLKQKEDEAH